MTVLVRHVDRINDDGASESVIYVIIEGAEDVAAFKKLVQQGSCLEPNLSPAMKEVADLVTTGTIQQPYKDMPK